MYICSECGAVFTIARDITIIHQGLSGRTLEDISVCPICENGGYEEAVRCSSCGGYTNETQARFGLCADCEIDTEARFKRLLEMGFTDDEREYLNNQYDGKNF